jgi:hypothetical protein
MISHPVIDGDPGGLFADYELRCGATASLT